MTSTERRTSRSSTRPAPGTRSRPASSSAASSSGSKLLRAASHRPERCRDVTARHTLTRRSGGVDRGTADRRPGDDDRCPRLPAGRGNRRRAGVRATRARSWCGSCDRRRHGRGAARGPRRRAARAGRVRGRGRSQGEPARSRGLHQSDGAIGATTVGATLAACRLAGIRAMATGGIGGVHRGYATRPDISADLTELARTPAVVVCSGVKSLLDVPATIEALETLGVPVIGFGTDTVPLFYAATGGPPAPIRADSARGRCPHRADALAARAGHRSRRRAAARPRGRRRGADRGGARRGGGAGCLRPGGDALRPLAPPRGERRPDARGQPPAGGGQRGPRRRDRRRSASSSRCSTGTRRSR